MMKTFFLLLLAVIVVVHGAERVSVLTFVMSKCPDCQDWALEFERTVLKRRGLADIVDVRLGYAAKITSNGFQCLHGEGECEGDIYQLCAYNLTETTDRYAWWNMSYCMFQDQQSVPDNAQRCAELAGLDYSAISKCESGDLGIELMTKTIKDCEDRGVSWTPTVFVNDQEYDGDDLLGKICDEYSGPKPAGCSQ